MQNKTSPRRDLDKALRSRVRLFGDLLGEVIREQAGDDLLETIETLRRGFIRLRKGDNPKTHKKLMTMIRDMDAETVNLVVRAYGLFFNLINIAEEEFQHKQRRKMVRLGLRLWKGSFYDTVRELSKEGMNAEQFQTLLDRLMYMPVFTAHPTEAKRRTVMDLQRRIFLLCEELDQPGLAGIERQRVHEQIKAMILALLKTNEVRTTRPEVHDEIRLGLYYFKQSIFKAVPMAYRYLERAVELNYARAETPLRVPSFLRFGSWIGGDRDGNPFVTAAVTREAAQIASEHVLRGLER
ncbi:MAG: phosphoenolpyruvate carboxylase, partial [Halothiobacillaceae bacterium]|nr:phosphoenolpyruvate carboxylase [Halothiobacillaceae bacterium]